MELLKKEGSRTSADEDGTELETRHTLVILCVSHYKERLLYDLFMINDKEEENKVLMFIISNSIYYVFGIGKILTQYYKNLVGTVSPEQCY